MFEAVCKSYYKRGNPKPKHKSPIEVEDIEKLKSYFSTDCPERLQEFVSFNLCHYLGRKGGGLARTYKELALIQERRSR